MMYRKKTDAQRIKTKERSTEVGKRKKEKVSCVGKEDTKGTKPHFHKLAASNKIDRSISQQYSVRCEKMSKVLRLYA